MKTVPSAAQDTSAFQEELQRVLSSAALKNSESLRRLLNYLAEAYTGERPRTIKEYTIGRDVMGKPEDYDPRVDASVRVQVGKLRQRLEQYYSTEAPASAWQIRLPKGHFELALEPRQPAAPAEAPPAPSDAWRTGAIAASVLAVLLGLTAAWLYWRLEQHPAHQATWPPEVKQFWAPFVDGKRPLTVVLGSPLFIRFHSAYFRDPWTNDWETAQKNLPLDAMARLLRSQSSPAETHRWTPFGEAAAAFRLASVLGPHRSDIVLKRSTVLSWEDVRSTNLVFLGPAKFNPQLRDLPVEQELIIDQGAVQNLHPRPGEPDTYQKPSPPNEENIPEDYAVITRLTGLHGWGEVLVLASTSTEGTWAAADFVTDPLQLRQLLVKITSAGGPAPTNYQVLVRSRFRAQVPIRTEYVTHRALKLKSGSTAH